MYRLISVILCCLFLACNSANEQRPSAKYEEKKTSLEEMERDSPLKFLKVAASHHGNLLNQTVVEGTVTNKATLVSYKNLEVLITFKDENGSVLEKQKHTLDDIAKPGTTMGFKIKTGKVKGTASIIADITSAIADK
jgi:hypothetical protein